MADDHGCKIFLPKRASSHPYPQRLFLLVKRMLKKNIQNPLRFLGLIVHLLVAKTTAVTAVVQVDSCHL
jgi:hypothetical protein